MGDRENEFPVFGDQGDAGAGGEAVLLEPVAGEAEYGTGVSPLRVRVVARKRVVMLSSRGFAGAAAVAGAGGFHSESGLAVGAHGRGLQQGSWACSASGQARAAAKPGMAAESSGASALAMASSSRTRAWLTVVCAARLCVEHGDVVAWEADAELGGSDGVRQDGVGVGAKGFFDEVERPGFEGFGHQFFAPEPFAEGGGHRLHFSGGDGGGHLGAGQPRRSVA